MSTCRRGRASATRTRSCTGCRPRASAVQHAGDLNEYDPQLAHRGTFFELDHPVIGEARFEGGPVLFSGFEPDNWRSAPLLGEDNEYVFTTLLGMSREEIDELTKEGIL